MKSDLRGLICNFLSPKPDQTNIQRLYSKLQTPLLFQKDSIEVVDYYWIII